MKLFFMAVLMIMVMKGIAYIICPAFIKKMALILVETKETQIVVYGWILVFVSFIVWVSYVRHMAY
ncbi:MAG: DUF2065 family protein [Alphaproteobacteria bacterium]|nr:DUF2065 family protein [Alphaproteobacteria bacterium]